MSRPLIKHMLPNKECKFLRNGRVCKGPELQGLCMIATSRMSLVNPCTSSWSSFPGDNTEVPHAWRQNLLTPVPSPRKANCAASATILMASARCPKASAQSWRWRQELLTPVPTARKASCAAPATHSGHASLDVHLWTCLSGQAFLNKPIWTCHFY